MSTATHTPGLQKAAILLVVLGEEAASHIYRNLPETDVQRLTRRIAELERFKPETAIAVLEEYHQLTVTQGYLADGGPEYAQKLLVKAFGEPTAKRLLEQVANTIDQHAVHLESLQEADPQQLAKFLEVEHPQTIALILAHLNARQASALLLRLPEEVRADTVKRLAQLRQFSPEVAEKVAVALNKRLESLGEQSRRAYAGLKGAAELLNQIEPVSYTHLLFAAAQVVVDVHAGAHMFCAHHRLDGMHGGGGQFLIRIERCPARGPAPRQKRLRRFRCV